jgi:hypothetical protein
MATFKCTAHMGQTTRCRKPATVRFFLKWPGPVPKGTRQYVRHCEEHAAKFRELLTSGTTPEWTETKI